MTILFDYTTILIPTKNLLLAQTWSRSHPTYWQKIDKFTIFPTQPRHYVIFGASHSEYKYSSPFVECDIFVKIIKKNTLAGDTTLKSGLVHPQRNIICISAIILLTLLKPRSCHDENSKINESDQQNGIPQMSRRVNTNKRKSSILIYK